MNFGPGKDNSLDISACAHERPVESRIPGNALLRLHLATQNNQIEIMAFLLEHRDCAQAVDADGTTPLHLAAARGYHDAMILLIEHGAQVDARDHKGQTPLHMAATHGHLNIAQYLVEVCGADVDVIRADRYAPIHLATSFNHPAVVQFLLAHHARVDGTNCHIGGPLHIALRYNQPGLAQLLLSNNTAHYSRNKFGRQPLDVARGPAKAIMEKTIERDKECEIARTLFLCLTRFNKMEEGKGNYRLTERGLPTELVEEYILPHLGIRRKP